MPKEQGQCEARKCDEQSQFWSNRSNGMGLIPYCVDCGRNLCDYHLARHLCRAMRDKGIKKGGATKRYEDDLG